jgi:hypothetical protein
MNTVGIASDVWQLHAEIFIFVFATLRRDTVVLMNRMLARAKAGIFSFLRYSREHRSALAASLLALLVIGVIAPLVAQQKSLRKTREEERDSATLIRKRADWFFKQRAYPLGHIPAGAKLKAIQQMEQMQRTQGTLMDRFAAQARTGILAHGTIGPLTTTPPWTSIGPQPTSSPEFNFSSGRVNAIEVDPCDTTGNTIYIAGAQGGVWKTTDGGTNWTALTDSEPSLAGGSLAVDPFAADCSATSPSHTGAIYFGTGEENFSFDSFYGAGVLTSRDGGATWTKDSTFVTLTNNNINPQNPGFAGPFIGSLSVDPATSGTSQVLLAGIQGVAGSQGVSGSGIWRSTDGGTTWAQVLPMGGGSDYGTGVAFDPGDSSGLTAYAALGIPFPGSGLDSNNGLWKSTDGGNTWSRIMALDNAVNSALGSGASSDYGRITIALAPGNPPNPGNTTIVVAIADLSSSSSNLLGTFISTNGGSSFAQMNSGPFCNAQCFYDISIGIDPANPNFIFLGGGANTSGTGNFLSGVSSVIFSSSPGTSFTDVSLDNSSGFPIHVDNHAFAFAHPTTGGNAGQTIVYVGDDGGVWSSSNVESGPGSQTWNDLNTNLSLTQFYPGNSIHPSNPQVGFAGAQDNGTQKFDPTFNPPNPQETHDVFVCGDGSWTAINPSTPSTVYAACEDIGNPGTVNMNLLDGEPGASFQNWIAIDTPAMDNDAVQFSADFVPPLVVDPSNPQNIYFGTYRLWQSTSGGVSWNPISPDLTGVTSGTNPNCGGTACVVTTMAVAPTDSNTVYVGTDLGGIWATTTANLGTSASFSEIDNSSTPGREVTQIAVSPASSKIAYVGFSGFSSCSICDGKGHIFEFNGSTGTDTFTNITGNLPDTPVNDIVLDPNDTTNNTIYVATDVGVFGTTNGGTSWSVLASGLPHVESTSLKLNNTARVLWVGTHGRGEWALQLPFPAGTTSALTGMSPVSATAGASGFTLTLNGMGFTNASTVSFGGSSVPTTFVSANRLTANVSAGAITAASVVPVTVSSAAGSLNFSVEGPQPSLGSVSPNTITSTANSVTLTVTGSSFTANTGLVWTPEGAGLSQNGNPTLLAQDSGSLTGSGSNMSFTVTVPASLLQTTLSRMVPVAPRRPQGPDNPFWLLAAAIAAIAGMFIFTFVPRRRRLIFGTTLTAVVVLLFAAGCSNSGSGAPPPPNSAAVAVQVFTPGPGGGINPPSPLSAPTVTVQ